MRYYLGWYVISTPRRPSTGSDGIENARFTMESESALSMTRRGRTVPAMLSHKRGRRGDPF
jgi:hypothetical protein